MILHESITHFETYLTETNFFDIRPLLVLDRVPGITFLSGEQWNSSNAVTVADPISS